MKQKLIFLREHEKISRLLTQPLHYTPEFENFQKNFHFIDFF